METRCYADLYERRRKTKVCTECGNVERESIDKLGHDMVGGSCVEPARCSRCGALAYSDHEYGEEKVIESPIAKDVDTG